MIWNPVAKYAVFLYEATASDLSLPRRYASTLQRESSRVTRGPNRHEASGEAGCGEDGGQLEWSEMDHAGETLLDNVEQGEAAAGAGTGASGEGAGCELAELAMIRWVPVRVTCLDQVAGCPFPVRSSHGNLLRGWRQVRTLLNESNPRMHPYVLAPLVNSTTGALLKFLGDEAAKRRGLPPSLKTSGLKAADAKQHGGREASGMASSQSDSQKFQGRQPRSGGSTRARGAMGASEGPRHLQRRIVGHNYR